MNEPPLDDTVRARMQGIRRDIDRDLVDVSASARNMVDWKHYVQAHPWMCLGTAAAVGFLLVPKRSAAIHTVGAVPAAPAKTGTAHAPSAAAAARGFVDALVAAVVTIAAREATAYVGQYAGRLLGIMEPPGDRPS